jgi:hypothetical protein
LSANGDTRNVGVKVRLVCGILAGALLVVAVLLAASAWSGVPWRKTLTPSASAIHAVKGAAFELRLPNRSHFVEVRENGILLSPRSFARADVAEEGRGIFFLNGDTVRFSASDNTDPRTNGRAYRFDYGVRHAGTAALWLGLAGCSMMGFLVVRLRHLRTATARVRGWIEQSRRSVSVRFGNFTKAPARVAGRFVIRNGWLLALAVPSVMLLVFVPPLWRDSDGFWQLAERPGVFTILHWPPLYTFGARVPLWIGTWCDWLFWGGRPPGDTFFFRPHFSNPAIYAVLVAQHLFLVSSLAALVAVLSTRTALRYGLAVFFALNAYLYLFAQTIGSESLSNTLTLAFLATVIVILRRPRPHFSFWIVCGALLAMAVLTRHINVVLAAVLPLAFLLTGIFSLLRSRSFQGIATFPWGQFVRAVVVGVLAISAAIGTLRLLCAANGIEYRSRQGYTFQFRLDFLAKLSPSDRGDLLRVAGDRVSDPALEEIIRSLDRGLVMDPNSGESVIHEKLLADIERAGVRTRAARLAEVDRRLGALARAFLFPPSRVMTVVVLSDFSRGLQWTPADIAKTPIHTTNYLISVRSQDRYRALSSVSGLQHTLVLKNLPPLLTGYIGLWQRCPLWIFPAATLLVCLIFFIRERFSASACATVGFCLSLVVVSAGLMLLNCAMTFSLPRFWIPWLILTQVSLLCAVVRPKISATATVDAPRRSSHE